jgi:hypothetical protein
MDDSPEQRRFRSTVQGGQSRARSSEVPVPATVSVKNQKKSHWFMCYRFVQQINVAQSSERSINEVKTCNIIEII